MYNEKHSDFQDWLNDVYDVWKVNLSEIKDSPSEYWFEECGDKIAYWDRVGHFGFIVVE